MFRSPRSLLNFVLCVLMMLPAASFAGERKSSDRRSGSSTQQRDGDRSSPRSSRGGSSSRSSRGERSDGRHGVSSRNDSARAVGSRGVDSPRGDSVRSRSRVSSEPTRSDGRQGGTVRSTERGSSLSRTTNRTRRYSHNHWYGYGHTRRGRVVIRQPAVVVNPPPRVVVRSRPVYTYPRNVIEPMWMSPRAFDSVLWDLRQARFEDDRLAIIDHVSRIYTVETWQVVEMVSTLRFSDGRLEALSDLYPRVIDRQNWFQVYDLLTFSSHRRALRSRCGF